MSKEAIKNLIELVPDEDIGTLYNVIVKFIPEEAPEPGELEAIAEADEDIRINGTVSHNDINWN